MPINQPSNQIKFTNVSIVRLKKGNTDDATEPSTTKAVLTSSVLILGKKRFELACYKNKLLEYRSGAEKDLDNVLQVPTVFLSVSKAQTAPSAELTKAFGADTPQTRYYKKSFGKARCKSVSGSAKMLSNVWRRRCWISYLDD